MNTTTYKPPRILGGSRLLDAIEEEEANKAALHNSIRNMGIFVPNHLMHSLNAEQLELILQYKDFRVIHQTQWSDDRNYITDSRGRSFIPTEELPDHRYRTFNDAKTLAKIKDGRAYIRAIMTLNDETAEERKERKLLDILDTIPEEYQGIVSEIKRNYMHQLTELTLDKYEITIRRYLAGMLRSVASTQGRVLSIAEVCDALTLDSTRHMTKILTELEEMDLYSSNSANLSLDLMVTHTRNLAFQLLRGEIIEENRVRTILSEIEPGIDFMQDAIIRLSYNPAKIMLLALVHRSCEDVTRSFLKRLQDIGMFEDTQEVIIAFTIFRRLRRKEKYDDFLMANFSAQNHEDISESVIPEEIDNGQTTDEQKTVVDRSDDMIITSESLQENKNTEAKSSTQKHYVIYDIRARIGDKYPRFVVGSSEKIDTVLLQLKEHLRTGKRIRYTLPYDNDTWIFYRSLPRELFDQQIEFIEVRSQETLSEFIETAADVVVGMPGEVYRYLNQNFKEEGIFMITPYTSKELRVISSSLRHNQHRMKPINADMPIVLHSVRSEDDLQALSQVIQERFVGSNGSEAIIHNIRELFENPENIVSLLDLSLQDALKRYGAYLLSQNKRSYLQDEMRSSLQNYKVRWQRDTELLQQVDSEDQFLLHLQHLPELKPSVLEKLEQLRLKAVMGCHMSQALAGQPGSFKIHKSWSPIKEQLIDHLIYSTFQWIRVVSANPGDYYESHDEYIQSIHLLDQYSITDLQIQLEDS